VEIDQPEIAPIGQEQELPPKDDLWIFIMAGQSNMAGRAQIEVQDRIENDRILSINSENEVIVAQEPIHFYEPSGLGLDCGMSFGSKILEQVPNSVSILLIPTAIGGSSIEQWINDETHRGVQLLSNLKQRMRAARTHGVIKGVLWHQGEGDAHEEQTIRAYEGHMQELFEIFRAAAEEEHLPIVVGHLGSFAVEQDRWDSINAAMDAYSLTDPFCEVVETADLDHKGDKRHFNSAAQRILGQRYAETMLKMINR